MPVHTLISFALYSPRRLSNAPWLRTNAHTTILAMRANAIELLGRLRQNDLNRRRLQFNEAFPTEEFCAKHAFGHRFPACRVLRYGEWAFFGLKEQCCFTGYHLKNDRALIGRSRSPVDGHERARIATGVLREPGSIRECEFGGGPGRSANEEGAWLSIKAVNRDVRGRQGGVDGWPQEGD